MKTAIGQTMLALLLIALTADSAQSQISGADRTAVRSISGQFIVHQPATTEPSRIAANNPDGISLEPGLLAVSCERIKQNLARQLGTLGESQGQIHIYPRQARGLGDPADIVVNKSMGRWVYYVDVPDSLDRKSFTLTIVHALLLEVANRNATTRSAEIPFWLADGLTELMVATSVDEMVVPALRKREGNIAIDRMVLDSTRTNMFTWAHGILNTARPLSFEQLSWPNAESISGDLGLIYRATAQVFVDRLLRLPNGAGCIRQMLVELPNRFNWQFAFLSGFQRYFQDVLDVEKWWALQAVEFVGHSPTLGWTVPETVRRLDEMLVIPVETRSQANELPQRQDLRLQDAIKTWPIDQQQQLLRNRIVQLNAVRLQVAPTMISLVEDYRNTLAAYLQQTAPRGFLSRLRGGGDLDRAAEQAIDRLNSLDLRLHSFLPPPTPTPTTTSTNSAMVPVR